jgi:Ni/Co efflux regulator RcnB
MKTKFYALLASVVLIGQVQAGGGRGGGGGHFAGGGFGPGRSGGSSSFHSAPMRSFGGSRMIYSSQRFSSAGLRAPRSTQFRPRFVNPNATASVRAHQFAPANINRGDRFARLSNAGHRAITNPRDVGSGTRQFRNGNNLPSTWRNHVVAQHSANWHRDWNRNRDHFWHGHHCRFINGSWVIFDLGFFPWWPDWYPYGYYADDYYYGYPYSYDPGYYDSGAYRGEEYYQNGYGDEYSNSTVAAAQQRLAQEGYYRGEIDGILGPETRRAIARYQNSHGLRATGDLTNDTLQDLGLGRS